MPAAAANEYAIYISGSPVPLFTGPLADALALTLVNNTNGTLVLLGIDPSGRVGNNGQTLGALTTGSTITPNLRSATVNPAGNITGVILAPGVIDGQEYDIINLSSNTVTFAAAGTSNVADGASAVIAALRMVRFKWIATAALWYRTG